ncbi:hypothetical protein [Nocardia cyriacigeorgica]|uniref:hypothetical protein n=1 Tax=Nocardia cyriacigeorgica TaxID=135487 RepID=UPI0024585134|nr:hypothetical protein [Nocardia cyriacigeorgica]
MIAMSHVSTSVRLCDSVTAEYHPPRDSGHGFMHPASIWVVLESSDTGGHSTVFLDIEDARELAELLPALVMAHDAAERSAAEKSAAESKAA